MTELNLTDDDINAMFVNKQYYLGNMIGIEDDDNTLPTLQRNVRCTVGLHLLTLYHGGYFVTTTGKLKIWLNRWDDGATIIGTKIIVDAFVWSSIQRFLRVTKQLSKR